MVLIFFSGLELGVQSENIDACSISPDSSSCYTSTSSETELLTVEENDKYSKHSGSYEDIIDESYGQERDKVCEKDAEVMDVSEKSNDKSCEMNVVNDEREQALEKFETDNMDVNVGEVDGLDIGFASNGRDTLESDLEEISNRFVTEVLDNLQQDIMNENMLKEENNDSVIEQEFNSCNLETTTTAMDYLGKEPDMDEVNILESDIEEMQNTGSLIKESSGLSECQFLEKDSENRTELNSIVRSNENVSASEQPNDINSVVLIDAALMTSRAVISDSVSLVETSENEHATGFHEVNPQNGELIESFNVESSAMSMSAITNDTISPVETPENEHAKGFYQVNPEKLSDNFLNLESSAMTVSNETISPIETPEHEHASGFYEVNPVINVSTCDTKEDVDDNFVEEYKTQSENEKLHAELKGTVLQNIDIGKVSSPVESPLEDNIAGTYQINPMIPDITVEEVTVEDNDVKSDVFDMTDAYSGVVIDEKFKEMTSNLVESVITGAIQIVVNMKQTGSGVLGQTENEQKSHVDEVSSEKDAKNVTASDEMYVQTNIEFNENFKAGYSNSETIESDTLQGSYNIETANEEIPIETTKETPYPADSDSDDSAGSSTTTEGSYRISNSRDTSPLNTPENTSSLEDYISNQRHKNSAGGKEERECQKNVIDQARNDDELRELSDITFEKQKRNELQNVHGTITTQNVEEISSSDIGLINDNANENNHDIEGTSKQQNNFTAMDIGDSVEISEFSSEESDYLKEHKSEYTTRKQIFMTSAGRMSISIDSVMDPPSDLDQSYMVSEKETIHEEHDTVQEDTRAEVNYIIARARSIVGHADETLARLSDATIARLRQMAHVDIVDDTCLAELDVAYDFSSVLCEVLSLYVSHLYLHEYWKWYCMWSYLCM